MEINGITGNIIDAAIKIHIDLGPGLLEVVYERILAKELARRGLRVSRQISMSFTFDELQFNDCFRVDILVEDCVVVEIKSVEALAQVHFKQLLTYVRLSEKPVGLLLNFGEARLKDGIRRIVNSQVHGSPSTGDR